MEGPRRRSYDAIVIGAGVIGLACAWRAVENGLSVLVLEREEAVGRGASGVAAGMLAPVTEADFGEQELLRLNIAGRERWSAFAARLEEQTGLPTGYREGGALIVATDRDDRGELQRLHGFQRSLGLDAEWLAPSACRRLEPGLSPRIAGGVLAPLDAQVDPRAVLRALAAAFARAGGEIALGTEVEAVETRAGRASGVRLRQGAVEAADVVVAAGAWSPGLAPEGAAPSVRPVKGQILELRTPGSAAAPFERVLRTPRCYLIARGDGRVTLGATVEEKGFDTAVTADGVYRLLEAAWELLPDVGELELVGAHAGLRPGTPDNRPLIGRGADGIIWATGHYRNGVLLAPITAEVVLGLLGSSRPHDEVSLCSPERFAGART